MMKISKVLDGLILKNEEDILVINQDRPERNGVGKLSTTGSKKVIRFANGEIGEIVRAPLWQKLLFVFKK